MSTMRGSRWEIASGRTWSRPAGEAAAQLAPGAVTVPRELRELAEEWDRYTPLSPGMDRVETDSFVLVTGPTWASVTGVRTDDVAATVEEVLAAARERGRMRITWNIGPSSRPLDLEQRLRRLGLGETAGTLLAGLALSREPEPGPPGV